MSKDKRYTGLIIVIVTIVITSGYVASNYWHIAATKPTVLSPKKSITRAIPKTLPLRITIPAIKVNAAIQQVGLTPLGAMAVPNNVLEAGWYNVGPLPGDLGSAVIGGHYDGEQGSEGVFYNLRFLKTGDIIYIVDSRSVTKSFIVRGSRIFNPEADSSDVFGQTEGHHLNLITCFGVWDNAQKSYSNRLVVFADAVH